ncbi:MAG: metal-dependent hydrolase [Rhodobacteraceae bacterium]|nr:metal-dependent hydrolase [Paracoccaceae bacterium]
MKLVWLGHSGFRLEIAGQVLLIDPWLSGNPMFPAGRAGEATAGATAVLLTHGHGDHASNALAIAREQEIPIACIHELSEWWNATESVKTIGFGKGGTIALGEVRVTMVNAVHSSSTDWQGGRPVYAGSAAGFMIAGEGHVIYVSGDTDVMADMKILNDLHHPDIGILSAGGWYTMDMARAAYAARTFFDFRVVVPCHYRTFPILEQSAKALIEGLPGVRVIEPEVLVPLPI